MEGSGKMSNILERLAATLIKAQVMNTVAAHDIRLGVQIYLEFCQ